MAGGTATIRYWFDPIFVRSCSVDVRRPLSTSHGLCSRCADHGGRCSVQRHAAEAFHLHAGTRSHHRSLPRLDIPSAAGSIQSVARIYCPRVLRCDSRRTTKHRVPTASSTTTDRRTSARLCVSAGTSMPTCAPPRPTSLSLSR